MPCRENRRQFQVEGSLADGLSTLATEVRTRLYIFGDVDRVREQIDRQLLAGNVQEAAILSQKLTSGIANLARVAKKLLAAEVIMAGGDEVLLRVLCTEYSRHTLKSIAQAFNEETGCTISFGVHEDVALAYLNLRRAKANGGNTVVEGDVEP